MDRLDEGAVTALARLDARSLKEQCVDALERLIISGELAVGRRLPPERELANQLGVSRPVLHEALVELASRGFVAIEPRRGVRVRDYYRHGTLAILESIVLRSDGRFPREVVEDFVAFRRLVEVEAARLAAAIRGGEALPELESLLEEEEAAFREPGEGAARGEAAIDALTDLDVRFHLLLARASGNRILPLVMNGLSPAYRGPVRVFYAAGPDLGRVLGLHQAIVGAIREGRPATAAALTETLLEEGATVLLDASGPRGGSRADHQQRGGSPCPD